MLMFYLLKGLLQNEMKMGVCTKNSKIHLVWSLSTHYFESRQENQESQHLQHQLRLQQQPPQPVQQQHEELDQHDRQLHDSPVKAPGETIKDLAPDYNEAIVGHNSRQESPPPSYERLVFQM